MESRLEPARRRVGRAKRALTGAAAVGFIAALMLARVSHPGHAAPGSGSASGSASNTVIAPAVSNDDDGSVAQLPQVQTHVS
jgi:hypothetical protein